MEHTMGPWKTELRRLRADESRTIYAGQSMIALALDFNCTDRDDESDANARLIAAAPELLEVCKAALGLAEHMSEGDLYDQIKAAIAKATGGA